jgi:hypothetical protein
MIFSKQMMSSSHNTDSRILKLRNYETTNLQFFFRETLFVYSYVLINSNSVFRIFNKFVILCDELVKT